MLVLCPWPLQKQSLILTSASGCCWPGVGSLAGEEQMDLEPEGTGCSDSTAGLAEQSPTLGSAHLLGKVLALSTSCAE